MPFIPVRDLQTYYECKGQGPRLLYISGTGGDLRKRPNIFDSPLADHFEILAFDQRGLGQTSRPDIPYSMADYADDADALMEALGWQTASVMGVSFGGMVAQEFAVRYPHRINRLVLACTSSGGTGGASYPLHEFAHLQPEQRAKEVMALSDTRHDRAWQEANPEEYDALLKFVLASATVGADEPGREVGARRQIEARQYHDTYERLIQLQMPVFICGGRYDGIASIANQEALHSQIPNAQLSLFEGGHGFLMQDPQAYIEIQSFLQN